MQIRPEWSEILSQFHNAAIRASAECVDPSLAAFLQLPEVPGKGPVTEMREVFRFAAPLGVLGLVAERAVLHRYMRRLLLERNLAIQQVAANGDWSKYVPA